MMGEIGGFGGWRNWGKPGVVVEVGDGAFAAE